MYVNNLAESYVRYFYCISLVIQLKSCDLLFHLWGFSRALFLCWNPLFCLLIQNPTIVHLVGTHANNICCHCRSDFGYKILSSLSADLFRKIIIFFTYHKYYSLFYFHIVYFHIIICFTQDTHSNTHSLPFL